VIPGSSVTLHPGERREIFNAWFSVQDRFLKPVTTIFEMFGGSTKTLIIMDEDFKNTVKFNSAVHKEYTVEEKGVVPPMHYWNGGHITSGLLSSVSPSLVRMGNDMLMAYRDHKGNRIFVAELKDGWWNPKGRGWINVDSTEAIAATTLQGNMALIARDPNGNQMYSLWQDNQPVPFDDHERYMGPDFQWKPSVTTLGNTLHNTNYPPAIQAFRGKLYIFYTRPNSYEICMAESTDNGNSWQEVSSSVGFTSAGVATTVYKDRLYIFYRDHQGDGVFYKWSDDGKYFKDSSEPYFGFDVAGEPSAAPVPGDNNGIMVAGILKAEKHPSDFLDPPKDEAIIWTIMKPYES
jgi:hypothetical protein